MGRALPPRLLPPRSSEEIAMRAERVAHWVEIFANIGVIVTLMVLILQVADNTRALRGQAIAERGAAFTEPFLLESMVPGVLAKIKAVDGPEPVVQALMDRYNLTYEEGAVWTRHIFSTWTSLEAEFAVLGASDELGGRIQILLPFPDIELWFEHGGSDWLSTPGFRDYVEGLRATL
jgi:hypothetical protein